jgi:hypothetical protein
MARSLGRGIAPALFSRLDPGTAGTVGFLIRLISIAVMVIVASLSLFYATLVSGSDRIMVPNSVVLNTAVMPLHEPERRSCGRDSRPTPAPAGCRSCSMRR